MNRAAPPDRSGPRHPIQPEQAPTTFRLSLRFIGSVMVDRRPERISLSEAAANTTILQTKRHVARYEARDSLYLGGPMSTGRRPERQMRAEPFAFHSANDLGTFREQEKTRSCSCMAHPEPMSLHAGLMAYGRER